MHMRFIYNFILIATLLTGSFFIFDVFLKFTQQVDANLKEIFVGQNKFIVEIADTPALQVKGLSSHKPLLENQGMLFVFDQYQVPGFWMKDMNFPLDILWISNKKVVGISENLPPDNLPNRKIYYPEQLIDNVLEISAGSVLKYNIKIGDYVK